MDAARPNVAVSMSTCFLAHGIVTRGRIKGTFSSVIRCTTTMFRVSLHWVTRGISVLATSFYAAHYSVPSQSRVKHAGIRRDAANSPRNLDAASARLAIAFNSETWFLDAFHPAPSEITLEIFAVYSNIRQ